jgi:hypothetical protein
VDQGKQIRQFLLSCGGTLAVVVTLIVLLMMGYAYKWTGFREQTLWDWLQLLLAVIVTTLVAHFGQNISRQQYFGQQEAEENRAQAETLQGYLDQIRQLLLDKDNPLRQSKEGDEVSTLARALTLTTLSQLDGKRKSTLVRFLIEAKLIQGMAGMESGQPGWAQRRPIIGLTSADLSDVDLSDADLTYVILGEANLSRANLRRADLSNTILFNTDLTDADLSDATVSRWGGLNSCKSLQGATMPNGQKYEDWLKSKGRTEEGQNE